MTINPGQEHRLWTAFYKSTDKPQLDAYPVPNFPEGDTPSGIGSTIWYGDFSCKLENSNGAYTYYLTVKNIGTEPTMYHFRVWVP